MSSSDVSLAVDGVTVVNAALLNSYRAAIAAIETGATPLANVTLSGTPSAPTAAGGTNSTQVATTAFVHGEVASLAPVNSPTFTGTPAAPTAAGGTNTTQVATTAFVNGEIAAIPSPLPTAAMGDLLAGNNVNAWASLSASGAMDGDALLKDHTASPHGLRWGSVAHWPGGASLGSMLVHDGTSNWGTVTPTVDNQLLVSDDAAGFGVKFAAISSLPTATQKSDYAALTTDADRMAFIAAYLGLV